MSREGITRDLESLANVGVGGIVLFHVTQGISHGTVRFNSAEHLDLIAHVAAECERLGLQFMFHNADGWSSSGGPWITPEQSMKRVVWSETLVDGGAVSLRLPQPPAREGFYRDIAVLAYPALPGELRDAALQPVVTASDPEFATDIIRDGNPDTSATLAVPAGTRGWIRFSYDEQVEIRSISLLNSPSRSLDASLEISQDGENWEMVDSFAKQRVGKFEWMLDEAFEPVAAQHFRISAPESFELGELELSTLPRIPNLVLHTSLAQGTGIRLPERLDMAAETIIDPARIIDLSAQMGGDGRITARLPAGDWTIMRFGYTSTGATNVIASPEGTGLEVDKFSASAFMAHYDAFIGPVIARSREVAPGALTGVVIDSYEVGGQNWTQGYDGMFAERFGQSIIPWLPAYTGRLVSSAAETRDMLARVRSYNAELMRENYYRVFADTMAREGLESIVEPYGMGPTNDVDVGATASIPAGEFWMGRESAHFNDAVSAARLYGRNIVAAEGFTSQDEVNWHFDPDMGRVWGDRAWIGGINQFMFHRFAHQANTHVMPGMTMNRYGSHFDRTQPWWDEGGAAWFTYMARGQHLLRQGLPVTDVAMFVGEDSPVGCPERQVYQDRLPAGVEFNCLNAETLLSRSRFVDGTLELPNGARYGMIWWPQDRVPSDAALARMEEARAAGVPVALAHMGQDAAAVFDGAGLASRVQSDGTLPMFTERRVGDTHIFFVLNAGEMDQQYDLAFAASGHAPEMWNPVTGEAVALPAQVGDDGRTQLSLPLRAGQSTFLIFDTANAFLPVVAEPESASANVVTGVEGPWTVAFDPAYSDAGTIELEHLTDLSTLDDPEIRHFSGKATWRTTFSWNGKRDGAMLDLGQVESVATVQLNGVAVGTAWTRPFALDVSDAIRQGENILEIEVATLWVNRLIGDAALEDTSGFEPEGRWPERQMIEWYSANEPPPPGPRRTFATQYFQSPDDPLVPSGLIGPVTIYEQAD